MVEASDKPVVAAIGGVCMGGGLELALGCHYRVAAAGAQIALPEVKLGLLPGAGGTQRLPRAVGVETALNMIVSGASVPATQLAGTALFDEIVDGDLLAGRGRVRAQGRRRAAAAASACAIVKVDVPERRGVLPVRAQHGGRRWRRTCPAPLKCVDAVAAAVAKPFDEGLRVERELFMAADADAGVAGAAPRVLRRARGAQDSRRPRGHADARDRAASRSSAPARWAAASR